MSLHSFYHKETECIYYFEEAVPNPLPEDYISDPQAYYDEFSVATIKDGVLLNFWGTIEVKLSDNCTKAKDVVAAMLAFERTDAVRDSLS